MAERQQRRGRDRQAEPQPDRDDQAGLPARHRPHLAPGPADEPQERQLAAALQRDHRERVDHGDRREGEDDRHEQRAEPAVGLAVGVGRRWPATRGRSPAARDSGRPGPAGAGRRAAGSPVFTRIVPSSGSVWWPAASSGASRASPNAQRAGVDRHDGGVRAGAVAERDRHAVADLGVRGLGAPAPERDRVPVQVRERPGGHAGVEPAALPAAEDGGGDDVVGDAQARAERRRRQRDRRAHAGRGAHVVQRGRPAAAGAVTASSPARPAWRSWVTAWSIVVELNSSVQLRPTVSTSGVLADEKRRVAVRRFAEARKPPTRRQPARAAAPGSRPRSAPRAVRGSRPRPRGRAPSSPTSPRPCPGCWSWSRPRTAAPRRRARSARRSRGPGRAAAARPRRWRARASAAPCAARRPAASTASSAAIDAAADGRRDRQPAGADGEVGRGDAVAHEPLGRARGRGWPRARSPPPTPGARRSTASQEIMRRI